MIYAIMTPDSRIAPAALDQWVNEALERSNLSQAALAEKLNARLSRKIDRSTVNKMRLGKRAVSAEEMLAISDVTGLPLPTDVRPRTIAIAGKVGAGATVPVIDAYGKDGDGPQVEAPPGLPTSGVVAVEVKGDSMEPVYSAGDLLFYTRATADGVPSEAIGRRCVCEDVNGMGWVKQVKLGSEPGLFNLISLNPGAENQHDVRLKWAAPVRLHWPADLARKA